MNLDSIQISWVNWSELCDFVGDNFVEGTYLDDNLKPTIHPTQNFWLGLFLKIDGKKTLAKQGEYVVKTTKGLKIFSKQQYERLQKINEIERKK